MLSAPVKPRANLVEIYIRCSPRGQELLVKAGNAAYCCEDLLVRGQEGRERTLENTVELR